MRYPHHYKQVVCVFIYVVGEIQKDSLNKVGKLADISIAIFTKNDGNERREIKLQAK